VDWLFADVGGPYLGLRAGVKAHGAVVETCDPSAPEDGKPTINDAAGIDAEMDVQVGGSVDAFDHDIQFDVGPYDLYSYDVPIWSESLVFPELGSAGAQCSARTA
jgi:hypothetical protein